ncbi:MAG TPA: hypothetical protein VME66_13625 [Candidatus Acidoferrales bacterium]|nr:hypothetical protein [Candidatus Acidoferrales bacterium]
MKGSEEGFTLIEAVIVTGLLALGIGTVMAALLCALRPIADMEHTATLAAVVENVVTDLRASSAYGAGTVALATAAGTSNTFTVTEPVVEGTPVPIAVTVTYEAQSQPTDPVNVDITATAPDGESLSVTQRFVPQAPPVGYVFNSPAPSHDELAPTAAPTMVEAR